MMPEIMRPERILYFLQPGRLVCAESALVACVYSFNYDALLYLEV